VRQRFDTILRILVVLGGAATVLVLALISARLYSPTPASLVYIPKERHESLTTYDLTGKYSWYEKLESQGENEIKGFRYEPRAVVVPHDISETANISSFFTKLSLGENKPRTIVLIGSSPTESSFLLSNTKGLWKTPFGAVRQERRLTDILVDKKIVGIDDEQFENEWPADALIPFVARDFTGSRIVPIGISTSTPFSALEELAEQISKEESVLVVASVDFYHGDDPLYAYLKDMVSWSYLASAGAEDFSGLSSDGDAILYFLKLYTEIKGASHFRLVERTSRDVASEPFTTHLYGTFSGESLEEYEKAPVILLIAGDVMLDRRVDEIFKSIGKENMFGKIKEFADGADLFIFNHEGTFPDLDMPQTLTSLLFSFRKPAVEALKWAGFTTAGLANNHSWNFGESVYEQTKKNLIDMGFEIFGTPKKDATDDDVLVKEINGLSFTFFGHHDFGGSVEETTGLLRDNASTSSLDILYVHWGNEYQPKSSARQKRLAREFFKAGADIIVGHHPHVVQPYEEIGGKIVFYSLGNFIFDQAWSEETQHGLLLAAFVFDDRVVILPYPTTSKSSIPLVEHTSLLDNASFYPGYEDFENIELKRAIAQ